MNPTNAATTKTSDAKTAIARLESELDAAGMFLRDKGRTWAARQGGVGDLLRVINARLRAAVADFSAAVRCPSDAPDFRIAIGGPWNAVVDPRPLAPAWVSTVGLCIVPLHVLAFVLPALLAARKFLPPLALRAAQAAFETKTRPGVLEWARSAAGTPGYRACPRSSGHEHGDTR